MPASIPLSDLIQHEQLAEAVPTSKRINYSQDTPTKTHVPIPESIKGYTEPACINTFIRLIHPNMVQYVGSKVPRKLEEATRQTMINEIINNFVIYMLQPAPTRNNTLHWKLYDPIKYSKQPYYKWFLVQLDFFRRSHQRDLGKEAQIMSLDGTTEDYANGNTGTIIQETLDAQDPYDTLGEIYIQQIKAHLFHLSAQYANAGRCFEQNAYVLFNWRYDDELTNGEIASRLNISTSAVGQWQQRLRDVVSKFISELPPLTQEARAA